MAIIDSLNNLQNNIASAKQTLATNISAKGVGNITTANTLTEMAVAVSTIEQSGGGTPAVLEELSVTENGEYTPKEGVDGYSKVTVNVEGASGDNYLISPESLAKCYEYYSEEYQKYQWEDNNKEMISLDKDKVIFTEPWHNCYYDTSDSSYHQQYREDGQEYNTYYINGIAKDLFDKCIKEGAVILDTDYTYQTLEDWINSDNSKHINTYTYQNYDYYGNEEEIGYTNSKTFMFFKKNEWGQYSSYPFTNPLTSSEMKFYPQLIKSGYNRELETWDTNWVFNVKGANIKTDNMYGWQVSTENDVLRISSSNNDDYGFYYLKGEYFNFFYNGTQYKNILFDMSQGKFPFKGGVKNVCVGAWGSPYTDNYRSYFRGNDSIESVDISKLPTDNECDLKYAFEGCSNLKKISGNIPLKVTDLNECFSKCSSLVDVQDMSNWDISKIWSFGELFKSCSMLKNIPTLNPTNLSYLAGCFNGCSSLADLSPISGWNTSAVTSLSSCFSDCRSLTDLSPISGWTTSSVTDLYGCFNGCSSLTDLNLSGWNTSAVTSLNNCFRECSSLTDLSSISGWTTSSVTDLYGCFDGCSSLTNLDISGWDTSSVTNLFHCFNGCRSLTDLNLSGWNTSSVTDLSYCFDGCSSLTNLDISGWDTSSVTNLSSCFSSCSSLEKIPPIKLDGVTKTSYLFNGCSSLNKIILVGDPSSITDMDSMFRGVKGNGELTYDHRYDYTAIINQLKLDAPTWTAKPDYEAQECLSLSITADDVIGNATTTTVHYTAMTNGINSLTGERVEGIELKGDVTSEDFGENPSYTDSRQVTVSYSYMGQTATATITQTAKIRKTATVDLMGNWELAPSADVPNPNSNIYEGVFQSVHKGQGNAKDKMVITFTEMPNFELYIRSNGEAYYDYVFAGKLDQADPTEDDNQASAYGNQQAGTDLASYTKVEYPNDGGQHTVTVVYRKDGGGDQGTDRGYCFFPFAKPQ